jgi:hypothetical protein
LKTESVTFPAFRRAVVVSPTFEHGIFQTAMLPSNRDGTGVMLVVMVVPLGVLGIS